MRYIIALFGIFALSVPAQAIDAESVYIFNTLLFLIGGVLVMFMAAGFTMLEAGLVRTKSVGDICLKNILLYATACILFFVVGYDLMYTGVDGGYFGAFSVWAADDTAALAPQATSFDSGYSASSDFFFQMVFVATTASIVSGTIAERVKLFPFLAFTVILAGLIYPIQGAWHWGAGFLHADAFVAFAGAEFLDFAGSTTVHSTGGWAALVGALILGPRLGRYGKNGAVRPMPGSNIPMATLGTFILWFGWFGFNGASQLALGSAIDAIAVADIFVNTNMAAAGGTVAAALATKFIYKKVDITMVLNGALAGLVSITAEPLTPSIGEAILIGGFGALLVTFAVPFFDKLKIDDVVGAISVHLVCGIWGTLAVAITNDSASLLAQLSGVVLVGAFVATASATAWYALKVTVGIRLSDEEETVGSDMAELGMQAYPEFGHGSQKISF